MVDALNHWEVHGKEPVWNTLADNYAPLDVCHDMDSQHLSLDIIFYGLHCILKYIAIILSRPYIFLA